MAELRIADLLVAWAGLIAEYDAWEEMEDLKIFGSIKEALLLHEKYDDGHFFMRAAAPPSPRSVIEGIGAFVSKAISAYPSATRRACSSVHSLLHVPKFSPESEALRRALALSFARAAFSFFVRIRGESPSLWKPLLLAVSSCYLCYPDDVEQALQSAEEDGYVAWAGALARMANSSFELGLASESETKLAGELPISAHHPLFISSRGRICLLHAFFYQ